MGTEEKDDEAAKAPLDVSDLLAAYTAGPEKWTSSISVYEAPAVGRTPGVSLGPPVQLPKDPALLDDQAVWRAVAVRLGKPGRAVIRLLPKGGGPGQLSGLIQVSEMLWRELGMSNNKQPETITMPTTAPAAPAPAPVAPPPTDLIGVLMQSMTNSNAFMMKMMEMNAQPRADPAIAALQAENARLLLQLREPAKIERAEREEILALGEKMAGGSSGAVTLLAGPLTELSGAIKDALKINAEVQKINAQVRLAETETRQMEMALRAQAAGVPLQQLAETTATDEQQQQQQQQPPPSDDPKAA